MEHLSKFETDLGEAANNPLPTDLMKSANDQSPAK
jgi:hypothetical protein